MSHHYAFAKPMIAALNGPAVGGGLSLALCCDMLVMADDTYVADGHAKVNVKGGSWLLWFLPPMIARELAMTARRLSAEDCFKYGLANAIVPRGEVREKALSYARATTQMGPDAIRYLRQASTDYLIMANKVHPNRRDDLIQRGRGYVEEMRSHADPDVAEGMRAFVGKRSADYQKPS
jgi:enoyl-CoA hydratase/carnithine racemase